MTASIFGLMLIAFLMGICVGLCLTVKGNNEDGDPCETCGSPIPRSHALCFVCLADSRLKKIKHLQEKYGETPKML
jgi:hypothetical protein